MILDSIEHESCPTCGAETTSEGKKQKHCNGLWNEWRVFSCGCKVEFSPNFKETTISEYNKCPNDKDEIEKNQKRTNFKEKVLKYISKLKATIV